MLFGFVQLFLQGFRTEHRVVISLKHVRFLSGSLHDIQHKAIYYSSTQLLSGCCRLIVVSKFV
jgi:hypothetical protein